MNENSGPRSNGSNVVEYIDFHQNLTALSAAVKAAGATPPATPAGSRPNHEQEKTL